MRYILLLFLSIIIAKPLFAQSELASYRTVSEKFKLFFNQGQYDSIYDMYADNMRKATPRDSSNYFFKGVAERRGQIVSDTMVYFSGAGAFYKVTFDRSIRELHILLDADSRIKGLTIKAYRNKK
jgi:hypothetical protein